jgi:hypothetical protein
VTASGLGGEIRYADGAVPLRRRWLAGWSRTERTRWGRLDLGLTWIHTESFGSRIDLGARWSPWAGTFLQASFTPSSYDRDLAAYAVGVGIAWKRVEMVAAFQPGADLPGTAFVGIQVRGGSEGPAVPAEPARLLLSR